MRYDTELLIKVQTLLTKFDCLSQTSGIRSDLRNAAVGGSPNSFHKFGKAVDLVCDFPSQLQSVAQEALALGFNGIEIDFRDNHIHLDIRDTPWQVVFLKNGEKISLAAWLSTGITMV